LSIVSTFTLFTAASKPEYQGLWALTHREEIVKTVEAIKTWRQSAVAAARAEARFKKLPEDEQAAFSRRYQALVAARASADEYSRLGASIGRGSGRLVDSSSQPELPEAPEQKETEAIVRKTETWIEYPLSNNAPTRKEVEICKQEASRSEAVYRAARGALIALIADDLHLPLPGNPYIDPFVESLVGSTVENSMQSMVPENIPNLAAVREWWRSYQKAGWLSSDDRWNWNPPASESSDSRKPESQRPPDQLITERASLGVLALARRYEQAARTEAEARRSSRGFSAEEEEEPARRFAVEPEEPPPVRARSIPPVE
jgi:hypothetical protein